MVNVQKFSFTKVPNKMALTNSADPGHTASDQGLHCLIFH